MHKIHQTGNMAENGAYLENGSKMGYFGGMAWQGVKIGLIWGYSGHVQKQASKCGKNRQVLAGFSEMVNLGVQNGPKIGVKIGVFLGVYLEA